MVTLYSVTFQFESKAFMRDGIEGFSEIKEYDVSRC